MTSDSVTAELLELERALMQPAVRRSETQLKALICDDFREFGASGKTYDLTSLIALLAAEQDGPAAAITDFTARLLSPDIALVTYRTQLATTARLRSSIWRREDGSWKLQFHQGTPTV